MIEQLKKVRELIAKGWCQQALALDKEGKGVSEYSDAATQWCIVGAISRVVEGDPNRMFYKMSEKIRETIHQDLVNWNNAPGQTQEGVLKVLDEVIESCMTTSS